MARSSGLEDVWRFSYSACSALQTCGWVASGLGVGLMDYFLWHVLLYVCITVNGSSVRYAICFAHFSEDVMSLEAMKLKVVNVLRF